MKLNEKVLAALNEQVKLELNSAYVYLGMSLDMADAHFNGYSTWLRKQYQEEMEHAYKLISYIQGRQGKVELGAIAAYKGAYTCPLETAKAVLAHEEAVTRSIHALYELADDEDDLATQNLIQWYITEQIEEESTAQDVIDRFAMTNGNIGGMMIIDSQLGARQ